MQAADVFEVLIGIPAAAHPVDIELEGVVREARAVEE